MNKVLLSFLLICCLGSLQGQEIKHREFKLNSIGKSKDYLPNKVIFKLKESAVLKSRSMSGSIVTLNSAKIDKVEKKFPDPVSKNKATVFKKVDTHGLNRIYELTLADSVSIEKAINELLANEEVEYAEPLYVSHLSYLPNDPGYTSGAQAYLNQIKGPEAWNLIRNNPSIILAIVDSGSEFNHPDLAANISYNNADPIDGADNDNDGYIDNFRGWDFVGASGSDMVEDNNPNVAGSIGLHGVHVSGIAGAVTDNGTGVASVSFNTAKLMIVKVCADNNGTTVLRGYEGIKYAADHGALVINCSWGSEDKSFFGQDIVDYAISRGCLIVAAAGNSNSSVPQYPAAYDGVLAVANVQVNDQKSSSSNFGYYVSISAPGTNINSTVPVGAYGSNTGTSMSSPVVAGAAALVKSYLPHLEMQQVGELLRVTSDNINGSNPDYSDQLGKGRLNVYRALTESPPSIKKVNIALIDKGKGTIPAGDTLYIYADLKNFLSPVTNLQVTLKSEDPNVEITEALQMVGFIGTGATQNRVGPFKVYIKEDAPDNTFVEFQLEYSANSNTYNDFEGFVIPVNRDFLNLQSNTIATTVTSIGRIGFLETGVDAATNGFQYKGSQLLYEAGLMIGTAKDRVSDNVRETEDYSNNDFVKDVKVKATETSDLVQGIAEFNDEDNENPVGVDVKQSSVVYKTVGKDNFLITQYEVTNRTSLPLSNVYIGLFTDWDINGGATNVTEFDAINNIAYVYDKEDPTLPYAGVKLLSSESPAYFPLSNRLQNNILVNDNYTKAEKYETLSSGIKSQGLGLTLANGTDVSFVSGYGPFTILPNSSVKAAFAFIGADNLVELKKSAEVAQTNYSQLSFSDPEQEIADISIMSYPNPLVVESTQRVVFTLPEAKNASLELFNLQGQLVKTFIKNVPLKKGIYKPVYNLSELNSGIYFYRLNVDGKIKTHKISVVK